MIDTLNLSNQQIALANIRAKDEDNHTPLELAEARSDDDKKIADKEITGDIIDTLTLSSWRSLLSTFGLENIWDEWGLMGIILFWSLLITGMLIKDPLVSLFWKYIIGMPIKDTLVRLFRKYT